MHRKARAAKVATLTALDVLVRQRLSEAICGRRHRAAQQQLQLGQESLAEGAAALLEAVGVQVLQLLLRPGSNEETPV